MKYVYIPVFGKRSHPELNPKICKEEEIRNWYQKDANEEELTYFLSFTELPKISINPRFNYGNPIAVYTYPIRLVYKNDKLDVDFAHDRRFIHVLKLNAPKNKILDSHRYSEALFKRDLKILKQLFEDKKHNFNLENISKNRRNLNIFISFMKDSDIYNFEKLLDSVEENYKKLAFVNKCASDVYKRNLSKKEHFGKLWLLSMLMSVLISQGKYVVTWNKLLQHLGYSVVIDKGTGAIHPNEPCQAIFLSPKSYKLVDIIYNTKRKIFKFKTFLYKNKIPFSENDSSDKIIVSQNVEVKKVEISTFPKNVTINGDLSIVESSLFSCPDTLKVKELKIVGSNINKLPSNIEAVSIASVDQKLPCIPNAKLNALLASNSKIELIRKEATIENIILDNSIIRKIEEGAKIGHIYLRNRSKVIDCPDTLRRVIMDI